MIHDELLQCFNESGALTEIRPRSEVKTEPLQWWYGIATVWVVNRHGQILCSRRAASASRPGQWQTYFGGHVRGGETFLATARRELREETGILRLDHAFVLIDSGRSTAYKNFYAHYATLFQGKKSELRLLEEEIVETRWLTFEEYAALQASQPHTWCNPCSAEQHAKILQLLCR